ncbi:hypothetical protein [Anaerosporobacter sp.]|uniref:hypothetical protein n=1 Tax=Anaerosporobacter sp. TaxID=1872529 RepID=UPI00286EF629|nr:hypothetical protein [Anaerosporobacter sp.]
MEKTYTICMIIGIGIPLIYLLLGQITDIIYGFFDGISGMFEGLHVDFNFEIGDMHVSLLPFSIQSICAGLLVFGAVGKMLIHKENQVLCIVIAVALGYLMAIVVQTLIHKLKKIENTTYTKEELLLFDAKIVNTIIPGGFGSVSITTLDGITTSYPAKSANTLEGIRQDTKVKVLYFEKNIAIVEKMEEL